MVVGDYLRREAVLAGEAIAMSIDGVLAETIVLEELTWLYREDTVSVSHRAEFGSHMTGTHFCLIVGAIHVGALAELLRPHLPIKCRVLNAAVCATPEQVCGAGILFHSSCTWPQLARMVVTAHMENDLAPQGDVIKASADALLAVENRLAAALDGSYEDPEWYFALKPHDVLMGRL